MDLIANGKNVFITGAAGTGKSFLLNYIKEEYEYLHITSSTGISAINIGGQTLHSWAGIGIGTSPINEIIRNIMSVKNRKLHKKLLSAKMLAIDEISMISADIFELISQVLQIIRGNDSSFGGVQIILFGDFLQLPPISRDFNSEIFFCFESDAWKKANIQTIILNDIFRQSDIELIDMLNNLRFGELNKKNIELLRECFEKKDNDPSIEATILGTHNAQVETINNNRLAILHTKEKIYEATFTGNKDKIEFLKKNCIAPETLKVKIDAQVMMLKNTYSKDGIMNGSIGIVIGYSKNSYPIVRFNNGVELEIKPDIWALEKYDEIEGKIILEAEMHQIPLMLAWAITIHKSQGMTLDKIRCDIKRSFAEGQIYVALSRIRSINGLYIESFDINRIKANKKVIEFYRKIENI
jgi:ATP-dependent DNA helicase PIF1